MASFSSTLRAILEMDIRPFKAGLKQANSILAVFKKEISAAGGGGFFGKAFGVGAVVQAFRTTIQAAQDARAEAEKFKQPIDAATASVARYGDALDGLKKNISDAGVVTLSFFTRAGEMAGQQMSRTIGLLQGRSLDETDRNIAISEEAGANADKLSDPKALEEARKRGEERSKEQAREREKAAKEAEERRKKAQKEYADAERKVILAQLDGFGKVAYLQDEILQAVMEEANAVDETAKIEARQRRLEIAEEIRQVEVDITKENQKQLETLRNRAKEAKKAYEEAVDAKNKILAAEIGDVIKAENERLPTLDELQAGGRGTAEDRRQAREIAKKEAEAKRLQGRTDIKFNDRDARGNARSETGEERARRLEAEAKAKRDDLADRGRVKDSERGTPNRDEFAREIADNGVRKSAADYQAAKAALSASEAFLKSIDGKLTAQPVD